MFILGDKVRGASGTEYEVVETVKIHIYGTEIQGIKLKGYENQGFFISTAYTLVTAASPVGLPMSAIPYSAFDRELVVEMIDHLIKQAPVKCECGTDKAGGGNHSSYCPKAN